jgi:hypothetical protein
MMKNYTIPTAAMKNGNFQSILGSALPNGGPVAGTIYDPLSTATVNGQLTRTPFTNNTIPGNRFDPVAAKMIALYPATNQPIATGSYPVNDYFVSTPGSQTTNQGDLRMDHRLTDKDSLFGSMSWATTEKSLVPPFAMPS